MTKAEELLWRSLRSRRIGYKFRRQVPVGPYIADFACLDAKLIVELDGPPHDKAEQQARDQIRDAWLNTRCLAEYARLDGPSRTERDRVRR